MPSRSPRLHLAQFLVLVAVLTSVAQAQVSCADYERQARPVATQFLESTGLNLVMMGSMAVTCCVNQDLAVYDFTHADHPRLVASVPAEFSPRDLCVIGDRAYVATYPEGLLIYDISDLMAPVPLGLVDVVSEMTRLATDGHLIAVGRGNLGLHIIDASNVDAPVVVGSLDTPGSVDDLVFVGDHLYVVDGYYGIQVVDVSDPTAPVVVGNVDTGTAVCITAADDLLYVGTSYNGTRILEISDPAQPTEIGVIPVSHTIRSVDIIGDRLYMAHASYGTKVYDVSDPAAPAFEGELPTIGRARALSDPNRVLIFTKSADTNMSVYALENLDFLGPVVNVEVAGSYNAVAGDGNLLVAGYIASDPDLWDVSDPAAPTLMGSLPASGNRTPIGFMGSRIVLGDRNGLHLFDINDPANPLELGFHACHDVIDVTVDGAIVYAVLEEEVTSPYGSILYHYLTVVDFTVPEVPVHRHTESLTDAGTLTVSEGLLYCQSQYALRVLDLADPGNPLNLVDRDWGGGIVNGFLVRGDRAYLIHSRVEYGTGSWDELLIWDLSDVQAPVEVSRLSLPTHGYQLHLAGDSLFMRSSNLGILRLDLADESNPRLAGCVMFPHDPSGLALAGGYLWTTDEDLHLIPWDCADVATPVIDDELPMVAATMVVSPNPFNPTTRIRFDIPRRGAVTLTVYDVAGRAVATLVNETLAAGGHGVLWDGRDDGGRAMGSGAYLVRLAGDGFANSAKVSLVK